MFQIQYANQYNFDVVYGDRNFCVDMALWTCGCCKFRLDQLPCEHALVVVRRTTYEVYDLCSPYYSKDYWYESYKGVVHPLPHITQWSILEHISAFKLMPPDVWTTIGRRKKLRIPSVEKPTQAKCSLCRESGHNRSTCQNPISLHPTTESFATYSTNPLSQCVSNIGSWFVHNSKSFIFNIFLPFTFINF